MFIYARRKRRECYAYNMRKCHPERFGQSLQHLSFVCLEKKKNPRRRTCMVEIIQHKKLQFYGQ